MLRAAARAVQLRRCRLVGEVVQASPAATEFGVAARPAGGVAGDLGSDAALATTVGVPAAIASSTGAQPSYVEGITTARAPRSARIRSDSTRPTSRVPGRPEQRGTPVVGRPGQHEQQTGVSAWIAGQAEASAGQVLRRVAPWRAARRARRCLAAGTSPGGGVASQYRRSTPAGATQVRRTPRPPGPLAPRTPTEIAPIAYCDRACRPGGTSPSSSYRNGAVVNRDDVAARGGQRTFQRCARSCADRRCASWRSAPSQARGPAARTAANVAA